MMPNHVPPPMPAPIQIEEVARYPLPGTAVPGAFSFSPDGQLLTYLASQDGSLVRQLYALDLKSGQRQLLVTPPGGGDQEESLSLEEKLRRERLRQRELGITQYGWAPTSNRLLIPIQGDLYLQDGPDPPLRRILDSAGTPALDAHFSPDGQQVAFVQDRELYVISSMGDSARQITAGARETGLSHGLAEYIAQEEMGRGRGFWWSPDGQLIAFTQVDERHLPLYRIMHQGKEQAGATTQEDHAYPFAGTANARVRLGVVSAQGGEPVWMDLGDDQEIYLARVNWLPDGRLTAQVQNREQSTLTLLRFDPQSGQASQLLREESPVWINLNSHFRPLKSGNFVWGSERTGFCHLYLYNGEGVLLHPLTAGEWMVDQVVGLDQAAGLVYFLATLESPLEQQLYRASLEGGPVQRITTQPGNHSVTMDKSCRSFVDLHQSLEQPPTITVNALPGGKLRHPLTTPTDPRVEALALLPPQLVTLTNRDGETLHGAIYRPPAQFGLGPYPTIVSVYGGPHAQRVTNSWALTADVRAQYLARQGYLIFKLDNRGSARRGLAFEGAIRHKLGDLEVRDQVDGVNWLVEQGLTDPERVGVYGWSYGGYMALMCLAQAGEIFKAAVAGAPVTHWDGYDTHYTERYMGTPASNPQGYETGSVMHHVEKITGQLLLVHGLIDENVHFRHTARLINALIKARKTYDLLLFPDERHMPRGLADRIYMEERIAAFFEEHLTLGS